MKKFLAMTMAVAMMASLAACGGSGASSTASSAASVSSDGAASVAPSSEANTNAIKAAADLAGKKIGVQAGTTGETYVTDEVNDAEVSSYKSGMDAALDLKNGKIDAVVLDELPAKKIVEQNADLVILDDNLASEEYAIAVKKGNTELLDSINATIKKMHEDGSYEALVGAFMPIDGVIKIPEDVAAGGDKVIKMGTNAAFAPFEYVDGSKVVGFDITLSQYIAKEYGATLQVEDMAFDSLLSALQSGAIDFAVAGMSVTEARKQSVDFSDPYYTGKQVIILKK